MMAVDNDIQARMVDDILEEREGEGEGEGEGLPVDAASSAYVRSLAISLLYLLNSSLIGTNPTQTQASPSPLHDRLVKHLFVESQTSSSSRLEPYGHSTYNSSCGFGRGCGWTPSCRCRASSRTGPCYKCASSNGSSSSSCGRTGSSCRCSPGYEEVR